ncbi:MAG TPA: DEAD/DEAH box helicase, partial [Verrucomicrobiae bacterium]|nr:DEAD/DEAH box helicase [Verrucomicrobiae bacterium]
MKLSDLSRYGLLPQFLERVKLAQGENLLPLQSRVVLEEGLFGGKSLWISAPPSAGKTFLAELAFLKAVEERKKTIFAVPLKALAEEKVATFKKRYADLGVRVLLSTRDHPQSDALLAGGDFDLAVVIYEKLNQLLVRKLDILSTLGLLVVDEGQLLLDPERGKVLERIFFKFLAYPKRPQLVVLSAGVANFSELARWLSCQYVEDVHRPVPLKRGVLAEGRLKFYSGSEEQEEGWPEVLELSEEELWLKSIEKKTAEGEQILVFRKSKKECEELALRLAGRLGLPPASAAKEKIKTGLFSNSAERLWRVLEGGVAFHHADLLFPLRRAVEEAFRSGEIRVVVATSTLAWGVNLPAGTVFVDSEKFEKGPASGEWVSQPISLMEYENMAGRAGRLGLEKEGKAILIARSPLEKELFWQRYVLRGQRSAELPVSECTPELVLDLVSSGAVSAADEISKTYLKKPKSRLEEERLSEILAELETVGFLKNQRGKLFSTPLGKLAASSGFSVESYCLLYDFLSTASGLSADRLFDLIYSLDELSDVAGRFAALKGNYRMPSTGRAPVSTELGNWEEAASGSISAGLAFPARTLFFLSLFEDWKSKIPLREIEAKYRSGAGDLLLWAEGSSWVLETTRDLARFLALPADWEARLDGMAFEARFGLPARLRDLALAFSEFLFRDQFHHFLDFGFAAAEDVAALGPEKLAELFGAETGAAVFQKARLLGVKPRQKLVFLRPPEEKRSYSVYLDGAEEKNRFLAVVHDVKIFLPAKLFYYLFCLARGRFTAPEGWVSIYEIERREGQGRFIHRLK